MEEQERDRGRKYTVFMRTDRTFSESKKNGGIFQCKVKNQYRKALDNCNFASTNGKDCDLDNVSMNNLFLKHTRELETKSKTSETFKKYYF